MSNISLFEKNILYEDNHLIIVNKQPGELTQSDKTKDATLGDKVKDYLKKKNTTNQEMYTLELLTD
jgi:23S rRNA-/tRNA-specific pseudouridylate synthase